MRNRGIIFSTDIMVAFIASTGVVLMIVFAFSSYFGAVSENAKNFSHDREAVFFMDYLVKTGSGDGLPIGVAFFDAQKKRVVGNLLDKEALKNPVKDANSLQLEHSTVKGIFLGYESGRTEWVFGGMEEGCTIYERFALVNGIIREKAKIGAVFCE